MKHELNSTRSKFWRGDKRDYSEKSLEKTLIMRFHYCSLCANVNDTLDLSSRIPTRLLSAYMSLCAFAFFDGRKRTLLAHDAYTYPCIIPVFFQLCFFQFPPELLACQPETKEHRNSRYTRNNLYRFRRESDIRTESLEYRIYTN